MEKRDKSFLAIGILTGLFLAAAFLTVRDYGMTLDEPLNFGVGHKYLHFYRTGHLDIRDDLPAVPEHPFMYTGWMKNNPHHVYPLPVLVSALACKGFYEKTGWLDPVSAHHTGIILTAAFFLPFFFGFVRRHWGAGTGFWAVLILYTQPRFWGHIFNNIRDVPELIFYSLALIYSAEWILGRKARDLYFAAICFAAAVTSKMNAVFIPITLLLWLFLVRPVRTENRFISKNMFHLGPALLLAAGIILFLYPPLWTGSGESRLQFFKGMFGFIFKTGTNPDVSWSLYPLWYILIVTPLGVLYAFLFGAGHAVLNLRKNPLFGFLLVWLMVPVLRTSVPMMARHDGIRHFMEYMVPFSILAALGVRTAAGFMHRFIKLPKKTALGMIALFILLENMIALMSTHPFQTTYFNPLIGGLKAAQARRIPYACDYWYNSYRKAGEWLNEHADPDANVMVYGRLLPFEFRKTPLTRPDLRILTYENFPTADSLPPHTYAVVVPRQWWLDASWSPERPHVRYVFWDVKERMKGIEKFPLVYKLESQGGEILSIYYKAGERPKKTHDPDPDSVHPAQNGGRGLAGSQG